MSDILSSLLAHDSTKQSDFDKIIWFVKLMKWLQRPRTITEKNAKIETVYTVRLKYILLMLNKNPEWKLNFIVTISDLLEKISSTTQFSKVGFSNSGFIQEMISRIQDKLLPKQPLNYNLETLVYEIFPNEVESIYVDCIDEKILNDFFYLFEEKQVLHEKLKQNILTSSYILSVELLAGVITINNELSLSDDNNNIHTLPEFKIENLLQNKLNNEHFSANTTSDELLILLNLCEQNTNRLYSAMTNQGVKTELVHRFQIHKRKITRLNILLNFLNSKTSNAINLRLFISHLILEANHQKSFKSFIVDNLSLLTERIVRANSHIGENYVTYTWSEFQKMFISAAGGGAITSLTVYLKLLLSKLSLVGFIKGLADSLNYSTSFLLIQIFGGTLATKQPSATAPFIATELLKSTAEAQRSVIALLRTQFIAVLGNLSLVFPICFLTSWILLYFNHSLINYSVAEQIYQSTNVFGPSLFFAAFTGCLLFLASILGGWIENWIILIQLNNRILYNENLRKLFGVARTQKFADFVSIKANALGANLALGFLLGMTPQIIKFFGLSIDVRHVTLAMGAFATSLPIMLTKEINIFELINSVVGIFCIGFLNISVSFILAFLLASFSSEVKFSSFLKLLKSALLLILINPWLLIIPEKEEIKK